MKKKVNIFKRMYNSPAPQWLRVMRDAWNLIGGAIVVYLQAFSLPDHTYNIISATIIFIGSLFTSFCIILGKGQVNTELQETQDDLDNANQIIRDNDQN